MEPRYTASATACHEDKGRTWFRSATAMSGVSQADAEQKAKTKAREIAVQAAQTSPKQQQTSHLGKYPYPERVINEPVLERIVSPDQSGEIARITRNAYHAQVLNAYHVMFVDVDTIADTSNASEETPVSQSAALDALAGLVQRRSDFGFRVYATRAGLRYLCTSHLFDPASAESDQILKTLLSDKRYTLLCRRQNCYRARLTPKYWRCDPIPLPQTTNEPEPTGFFARLFHKATTPRARMPGPGSDLSYHATCHFVQHVGNAGPMPAAIDAILRIHDKITQATSAKKLA